MQTQDYAIPSPTSYQKVFAAQHMGERNFPPSKLIEDLLAQSSPFHLSIYLYSQTT